ncbi:MAG: hypothetical protein K8F91_18210 [Candidatus Obscuribacterales bacterium]|nr:hypothetical protein [Candidatus Obscuribacterales bacterium]
MSNALHLIGVVLLPILVATGLLFLLVPVRMLIDASKLRSRAYESLSSLLNNLERAKMITAGQDLEAEPFQKREVSLNFISLVQEMDAEASLIRAAIVDLRTKEESQSALRAARENFSKWWDVGKRAEVANELLLSEMKSLRLFSRFRQLNS